MRPTEWTLELALTTFNSSFTDLLFQAQTVHRKNFKPNEIQISTLLNIKTGNCPENCSYCPQSAHFNTKIRKEKLMQINEVIIAAKEAKNNGSTRFCMGAAWRGPRDKDLDSVCTMVREVKNLGLETCVTLGLLQDGQAEQLKNAGLDFYNHNIDCSQDFYDKVITTRSFSDRLDTLNKVRTAGLKVCCGGIIGLGETNEDRVKMLLSLASLEHQPESIPINQLIPIPGTPLENAAPVDAIDFVRTIAFARIMMPKSYIRLSAGREKMSTELQALCFVAEVNSIFYGEKLLTADNASPEQDAKMFANLGLSKQAIS